MNKIHNNNELLKHISKNNSYMPPDSRKHGTVVNTHRSNDKVYSGHNYEYIYPNINNDNNKNVCPMSTNKPWSEYLSGDNLDH